MHLISQMFEFLQAAAAAGEGGPKAAVKAVAATNAVPTFAEAISNPDMVMHQILATAPRKQIHGYDHSGSRINPW
jgi:hypothetical protein